MRVRIGILNGNAAVAASALMAQIATTAAVPWN